MSGLKKSVYLQMMWLFVYRFLRKSQLAMPEELKQHVKQSLKDGSNIEKTIFDTMEQEVTDIFSR